MTLTPARAPGTSIQPRLCLARPVVLPLVTLALAACAGGASPARAPVTMATANPVEATPVTGPRAGSGEAVLGGATLSGPMKPVAASAMLADLSAIGLDPAALPPLDQLEPDKLRRVMRTFTRSLGAVCADCHVENDFAASTPRKNVAAKMWDRFARGLSLADGAAAPASPADPARSPLYCDSCHAGRITPLLDRRDEKALARWMDANYVARLARTDGKEHGCATCHGAPFVPRFLASWTRDTPRPRSHAGAAR